MTDKKKAPKVISIKSAMDVKNGIILYAKVQSASRKNTVHTVTKNDRGKYACSCEPGMFNPGVPCSHVQAVKVKEKS